MVWTRIACSTVPPQKRTSKLKYYFPRGCFSSNVALCSLAIEVQTFPKTTSKFSSYRLKLCPLLQSTLNVESTLSFSVGEYLEGWPFCDASLYTIDLQHNVSLSWIRHFWLNCDGKLCRWHTPKVYINIRSHLHPLILRLLDHETPSNKENRHHASRKTCTHRSQGDSTYFIASFKHLVQRIPNCTICPGLPMKRSMYSITNVGGRFQARPFRPFLATFI